MKSTLLKTVALSYLILTALLNWILVFEPSQKTYDAIIVLGNSPNKNEVPNSELKSRLDKAHSYFKSGLSDKIILSGGYIDASISEAEIMKRYCLEQGIAEVRLIKEERSTSTVENIKNSTGLMRELKLESALVVTSAYHVRRARIIKEALGHTKLEVVQGERHLFNALCIIPLMLLEQIKLWVIKARGEIRF